MIYGLYVVYDKVAEEGSAPFVAKNRGIAKRQYLQLLASVPETIVGDYQLLWVGDYSDSPVVINAFFTPIDCSEAVDDASVAEIRDAMESLKRQKEEDEIDA